jgi:hypothetical protein
MRTPTTGSGWERHLPLSGAAFTTLTVAAAVAFPMPPGGDVSAASKPAWLAVHHNAMIAQSYLRALAAIAFIALAVAAAGACRRALPAPSSIPAAAMIGGAFTGGLLLLSQAVGLAAALFVHAGGSADTTRALGAVQNGFLDLSSLPAVLLFAAVGLTALRTGLLPRWLTVLTLLGVPFALLDAVSYDGGPFEAVGFLGLLYFLGWGLLTGVRLYLNQRTTPIASTHPEPSMAA